MACCDYVNRGAVFADGRVFYQHARLPRLSRVDAETGKELWKTKVGDINKGETMTMAPLVVKGKVLVGNSGGEFGVRGWIKALDAQDRQGRLDAPTAPGPDADCLIGPRFKPFYQQDRGKDLGVTTWPPDALEDRRRDRLGLDLLRPRAQPDLPRHRQPRAVEPRAAARRQQVDRAAIFARDPDTGEAVWYYQWSPHDLFDHDGVNENVLLDLPLGATGSRGR